jgi:hypothetical protein
MTCDELKPDYLLYAMGTMVDPEVSELRAHLDRGCPACSAGLRQAYAVAYSIGAVLDGPEAPRDLRSRVLAISGEERRVPFWARPMARWQGWALAMAALVLALAPVLFFSRKLADSRAQQAATAANLAAARDLASSLKADASGGAVPIFALELERGGGSGSLKQLAIPPAASAIVLALPTDLMRQASSAELRNDAGQTVWSASQLPVSDADSTGLTIPSRLLSPGRYTIVLIAGDRTLARLLFEVVARA